MAAVVGQLCALRALLDQLLRRHQSPPLAAFDDLQAKLQDASVTVHRTKKSIKLANRGGPKSIKAHEKLGTSVAQGWKTEVKRAKLDNHAMRAEDDAEAAISSAEEKVADAVFATYQAIEARIACNESGGGVKH